MDFLTSARPIIMRDFINDAINRCTRTTAVSEKGPEITSRGKAIARAQCLVADSQS